MLHVNSLQRQEISVFSKMSRVALGPMHPSIQRAPGLLSLGLKQKGYEIYFHLHPVLKLQMCETIPLIMSYDFSLDRKYYLYCRLYTPSVWQLELPNCETPYIKICNVFLYFMFMVPCIIIYSMKKPTDAAICSQFYSTARFTLHVSGVLHTHHQEYNF